MSRSKVIFASLGTRGDLYPFLALAVELKRQGHPVLMLGSEDFRHPCEIAGVDFESILSLEEHNAALQHPDFWKSYAGLKIGLEKLVIPTFSRTYRAIEAQVSRQQANESCVLVCNNIMLGARVAAEKFGLKIASIYLHPYSHYSRIDPSRDSPLMNALFYLISPIGRRLYLNLFERELNSMLLSINILRGQVGLPSEADVFDRWSNAAPVMIDLWPDWYCSGKADWPQQAVRTGFITYDGPAAGGARWEDRLGIRDFLAERPVVFTMGSGMVQGFEAQVDLFSKACRHLGRKGLMVSTNVKEAVTVNDQFRIIESAPFAELFPYSSLVVSHGGIGTVARTLASGRPTLLTPLAFDQFDNGHYVSKIGAGQSAPYRSLKFKRLAEKLDQIDGKNFHKTCDAIRLQMARENGLQQALTLIHQKILS